MAEINIIANGLELAVPHGTTLSRLLDMMEEPVRPDIMVEVNRKFVHLKQYSTTTVNEGDNVEVIALDIGG